MKQLSDRGFTLIEAMMSAAIVAIVSAALVGAIVGQSALNLSARNLTAAVTDATRVMESIRMQNTLSACTSGIPSAVPPENQTSWDAWISSSKSISINAATPFELVGVTCQDGSAIICDVGLTAQCPEGALFACPSNAALSSTIYTCSDGTNIVWKYAPYCGTQSSVSLPLHPAQVGTGEWAKVPANTQYNPIRVTVSVGWVQNQRANGGGDFIYTQGGTTSDGKTTVTSSDEFKIEDTNADGVISSQAMVSALITCR